MHVGGGVFFPHSCQQKETPSGTLILPLKRMEQLGDLKYTSKLFHCKGMRINLNSVKYVQEVRLQYFQPFALVHLQFHDLQQNKMLLSISEGKRPGE